MPISQSLITPDLALAFDISATPENPNPLSSHHLRHESRPPPPPDFDPPPDLGGAAISPGEEPARTLKRQRLVWTPQLHKRFVEAVAHLGIKNAVPKTIMQLMNVEGLTRENVASHLQKYRLYLKRMQGISGGGGAVDAATDRLFASAPLPRHLLARAPPYVPVLQPHHQIAAAQQQFYNFHRNIGVGAFDQRLAPPQGSQLTAAHGGGASISDSDGGSGARKMLTLFPTGEN